MHGFVIPVMGRVSPNVTNMPPPQDTFSPKEHAMNPYEHHDLSAELPEYKEQIHQLKMADAHFRKLYAEYETVCKTLGRMETGIETPEDAVIEQHKKQRLHLKDQLLAMLKKSAA
jgi:uncharacterized protein YdcH (DUF465 family)